MVGLMTIKVGGITSNTLADDWAHSESKPITSDLLDEIYRVSNAKVLGGDPKMGEVIEQSF